MTNENEMTIKQDKLCYQLRSRAK